MTIYYEQDPALVKARQDIQELFLKVCRHMTRQMAYYTISHEVGYDFYPYYKISDLTQAREVYKATERLYDELVAEEKARRAARARKYPVIDRWLRRAR